MINSRWEGIFFVHSERRSLLTFYLQGSDWLWTRYECKDQSGSDGLPVWHRKHGMDNITEYDLFRKRPFGHGQNCRKCVSRKQLCTFTLLSTVVCFSNKVFLRKKEERENRHDEMSWRLEISKTKREIFEQCSPCKDKIWAIQAIHHVSKIKPGFTQGDKNQCPGVELWKANIKEMKSSTLYEIMILGFTSVEAVQHKFPTSGSTLMIT